MARRLRGPVSFLPPDITFFTALPPMATRGRGMMRHFDGRVAVVTGGASGIGLASGALFAEQGMKVVLADIEGTALEQSVEALAARSLEVVAVQTDVSDFASVQRLE